MPRGYRCILVAVVGWLALSGQAPNPRTQTNQQQAATNQAQSAPIVAPAANEPPQPKEYYRPCGEDGQDSNSDLCAQWTAAQGAADAAFWAKWSFWFGLLGLGGLAATLYLTAKSTSAAIKTLEAQIASDRPLMHMETIKVVPQKPTKEFPLRVLLQWEATNFGKTGCWVEQVNITLQPGTLACRAHPNGVFLLSSFVAPDKGVRSSSNAKIYNFNVARLSVVNNTKRVSASGYILYRDAGGREWMTGFANVIDLTDDYTDKAMYPIPKTDFWFDIRRK